MNQKALRTGSLILIVGLALLGHVEAQQQQHSSGSQASGAQAAPTSTDGEINERSTQMPVQGMMRQMQGMMQQMRGMMQQMQGQMRHGGMMGHGMMGHGMMKQEAEAEPADDQDMMERGMMHRDMMGHKMMGRGMMGHIQRHMDRLTQQLELSDDQQMQIQALLRNHAKEGIRLKADIDLASLDLQQLLDTQPVDMNRVKSTLQAIAEKEADLRLTHIVAMQDIQKLLTPEQQQQFQALWGHMLGSGGKMRRGGMRRGK